MFRHIGESDISQLLPIERHAVQRSVELSRRLEHQVSPLSHSTVRRDGLVIGLQLQVHVEQLDPTRRVEVACRVRHRDTWAGMVPVTYS